jgi:hypothetical protein
MNNATNLGLVLFERALNTDLNPILLVYHSDYCGINRYTQLLNPPYRYRLSYDFSNESVRYQKDTKGI